MKFDLRSEGVLLSGGLRAFIEKKLAGSLGRLAHRVRRVRVRLTDVNGPRNGIDIRCHVQASVAGGRVVTIEELRSDPFTAVARASDRVRRGILRHVERHKAQRRGR